MKGLLFAFGIVLVSAPLNAAASGCQGEALGTNVAHESDCTLFYSCDGNGNGVVKSCIAGYYFDPSWRYCRPSSEISCVPSGGTGGSTATPTATPTTSTTKASTASTTTSTTKASTASTTTSTTKTPTASTTTSTTKAPTATPTTSTTKVPTASTTTSTTKAPTAAPPSGAFTGKECTNPGVSNGDLLPYPGDCTRFIQCSYTVAVVSNCPPGLHFNNSLKVCDWPGDAGCQASGL